MHSSRAGIRLLPRQHRTGSVETRRCDASSRSVVIEQVARLDVSCRSIIMRSRRVLSCSFRAWATTGDDELRWDPTRSSSDMGQASEKWDSVIMGQLPVGAAIIEGLDIDDEQQHLDVAAATGEPDLSIAKLAANGSVVLTNLVAEVVAGEATLSVR